MKEIKRKFCSELNILLLAFLMILISGICNRIGLGVLLKIVIYVMCCIIIPGGGIFRLLSIKNTTFPEKLLFIITYGYIWTIILYVLLKYFNLNQYLQLVFTIQFVLFVCIIYKKGSLASQDYNKKEIAWGGWALVIFIFSLIVFSLKNCIPTFVSQNSWHGDLLYWIGDIVSIKHKIPPLNFRTLEEGYSYHYLGALELAAVSETTQLSAALIAIVYSYVQSSIMFGLSAYCLVSRVISNKKIAAFVLFLFFFSTGNEKFTGVTWFWHLYQVPMSYNIAVSLEMIILLLIFLQLKEKKVNRCILFLSMSCLAVCTGTKGPAGAIIFVGIGIVCLYWLFIKKEFTKSIIWGICASLAFGVIYFLLLNSGNSTYIENRGYVDPYKLSFSKTWMDNMAIVFFKTIKYIRYYLLVNPWIFIPAAAYFIISFIKKRIALIDILLMGIMLAGTFFGYSMHYYGNSEMYFTLSVFPCAAILTGKLLARYVDSIKLLVNKEYMKIVFAGIIIMLVIMGNYVFNWKQTLYVCLESGINNLFGKYIEVDENKNNTMTTKEYEAYLWIMNNTEKNALFLSDKTLEEEEYSYVPGVFSERYIYYYTDENDMVEGKLCFEGNIESINHYIEKGVNYIVQNKKISPNFKCPSNYGSLMYENGEIAVYRLYS